MSSEIATCPHCGSSDIVYVEKAYTYRSVYEIRGHYIWIGKIREEDVEESTFNCGDCNRAIPEFDDLIQEFLF